MHPSENPHSRAEAGPITAPTVQFAQIQRDVPVTGTLGWTPV